MTNDAPTLADADVSFGNDPVGDLSRLTGLNAPASTPEPETPAETPPVLDTPEAPEPESAEPDAELDDDAPETPDADDTPAPNTAITADPLAEMLKGGKPLTYTVDGQKKETTDIVELEGRGAVIPPEALPRIRDRLQQADRLTEQNRKLYAETQEFTRVGGVERVAELERKVAQLDAAGSVLLDLIENPPKLLAMLRTQQDGSVALDPVQQEFLVRQVQVASKEAEFKAREAWTTRQTQHQSQATEAETRQATLDAQVRALGEGLPPEDIEAALQFFGPMAHVLYRQATAEDVAKYPGAFAVGQTIFDAPRVDAWVQDRKALRGKMAESAHKRTEAAKHNAAVTQQAAKSAPKPTPPRNPKNGQFKEAPAKPKEKPTKFDLMLRARAGKPLFDTPDEQPNLERGQ